MIQFIYSKRFKKEFTKLPVKVQSATANRLLIFSQNEYHPILNNHSLHGECMDYRAINITGDYRVVFQMLDRHICYLIGVLDNLRI